MIDQDEAMVSRVRAALDRSVDEIDADTMRKLNAARYAAINEYERITSPHRSERWMPASVFATAVIAVVALVFWNGKDDGNDELQIASEESGDIDMLSGAEEFEVFDDLEFFQWPGVLDETG